MMITELMIDLVLVAGTLVLALMCVAAKDLFKAIVLFVSLGLFVTIVWARLQAWDVAIAEAAIGAGLTGALLLATWRSLQANKNKAEAGD
jgi:energy-converting hydrogenase B subunit D